VGVGEGDGFGGFVGETVKVPAGVHTVTLGVNIYALAVAWRDGCVAGGGDTASVLKAWRGVDGGLNVEVIVATLGSPPPALQAARSTVGFGIITSALLRLYWRGSNDFPPV
jgi:hypothetical protein